MQIQPLQVLEADQFQGAYTAMTKAGVKVFMGLTDTRFAVNRQRVVDLAAKIVCRRSILSGSSWKRAVSCPMARTVPNGAGASFTLSIAF